MNSNKINIILDSLFSSIADVIVIPRSTVGIVSDAFKHGLQEVLSLEIPQFEYKPLGALEVVNYNLLRSRSNNLKPSFDILYATSVDNNTSAYSAVEEIIKKICDFTNTHRC